MANTKTSALTAASTLDGTEAFPCAQSAASRRASSDQIKSYVLDDLSAAVSFGLPAAPAVVRSLEDWLEDENVNLKRRFGLVGDGSADNTSKLLDAALVCRSMYLPEGIYLYKQWLPILSNTHLYGDGASSVLFNDKTNATIDLDACLSVGLMHPLLYDSLDDYALNAITAPTNLVTCTTSGEAANFSVGELVYVGTTANVSGVRSHGQQTKVQALPGSGQIRLADNIVRSIASGAKIFKMAGTNLSQPITPVENVVIENMGFKGRAVLSSKACAYNSIFRNIHMLDIHHGFVGATMTHVVAENWFGQYSGRLIEPSCNSFDVVMRNFKASFNGLTTLQTGETQNFPIHIGEQACHIQMDDIDCFLDERFVAALGLAQIKGYQVRVRNCNFRHGGTQNQEVVTIPSETYTGYPYADIVFEGGSLGISGATKSRLASVGSSTTGPPTNVHFRGVDLYGAVSGESIWFNYGSSFSATNCTDRTGKAVKISTGASYPMLNGYRRAS
jgi:hypothetical protein